MDRYSSVIKQGILRVDDAPATPRGKIQGHTNFQISYDMFPSF